MKVSHYDRTPEHDLGHPDSKYVTIRIVISPEDGASHSMMVHLTIQPGGHTPFHTHEWEEEVFVLSGNGDLETKDGKRPIRPGDAVFIDGDMEHQYLNSGPTPLEIICVIPLRQEGS